MLFLQAVSGMKNCQYILQVINNIFYNVSAFFIAWYTRKNKHAKNQKKNDGYCNDP